MKTEDLKELIDELEARKKSHLQMLELMQGDSYWGGRVDECDFLEKLKLLFI